MNFKEHTVVAAPSQSTTEYFHHPKKFPHASAPSPCKPLTTSDLCIFPFLGMTYKCNQAVYSFLGLASLT